MIKLTHPEKGTAIYVVPEKVTSVMQWPGYGGAGIHSGGGFVLVQESPEDVARLVEEATKYRLPSPTQLMFTPSPWYMEST